ncbi:hypothetical protein [Amycolatopsis rifamycinica]|uniref:hypothetical protein n=1 Tax=Amycolatopsis rifamycinica TaxID=287986 RepID=UPI00126A24F6|nr:hypothetical protein [Amycolatopsis rifamycinica]
MLFQTYVTAVQRATVVGLANTAELAAARPVEKILVPDESLPYDEWIARPVPMVSGVRSPRGYFVLHLRGGSPAGVTGWV